MSETRDLRPMTRRALIRAAFVAATSIAGAGLLAACGQAPAPTAAPAPTQPPAAAPTPAPAAAKPTEAPKATEAPKPTAAPAAAPTATPAAKPTAATQQINLKIHGRNTQIDDIYADVAKEYAAKHPNVKIDYERTPGQDYTQKQLIMAASKTSGDAYWACSVCLFGQFALGGVFADHGPLIKATNYPWDEVFPQAQKGVTIKGKIYGLPHAVHPGLVGIVINKTMFDKAGVAIPKADWSDDAHPGYKGWTFDDFRAAAVALTKKEGGKTTQWGFNISHHFYFLTVMIRSMGGDYLNPEGTKILFDTPEGQAGIGFLADLYNKDKVSPSPAENPSGGPNLFASGKIGMQTAGVYNIQGARETYKDFEWLMLPTPRGKGGTNGMFEFDSWSVLTTSKAPEVAFDFLAGIASTATGLRQAKMGGVPGSQKALWEDKDLNADPNFGLFAKIMKTDGDLLLPANYRNNELWQTSDKLFDPLFNGERTDTSALIKEVAPKLQAILDKPAAGVSG